MSVEQLDQQPLRQHRLEPAHRGAKRLVDLRLGAWGIGLRQLDHERGAHLGGVHVPIGERHAVHRRHQRPVSLEPARGVMHRVQTRHRVHRTTVMVGRQLSGPAHRDGASGEKPGRRLARPEPGQGRLDHLPGRSVLHEPHRRLDFAGKPDSG